MVRATWNGAVLAESGETIVVEGNHYFPPSAVNWRFLSGNDRHTTCWWKGEASYYDVEVEGAANPSAAWYYPDPRPEAGEIKGYVAFWHGVKVEPG
jgi:uncharacterized protein (DUF427 family)